MFKNAVVLRLEPTWQIDSDALTGALGQSCFVPCGEHEQMREGWAPPFAEFDQLAWFGAGRTVMLCLQREEKIIPAATVNKELEKLVKAETEAGRPVGKARKKQMREAVVEELKPKAFSRTTRRLGYLDFNRHMAVIDVGSQKGAEDWMTALRRALESVPAYALRPLANVGFVLTSWVSVAVAPDGLVLGADCDIDAVEDPGKIRLRSTELDSEVVRAMLEGTQVVSLALEWRERLSFVLSDDLRIKRLRYIGMTAEAAHQAEDVEDREVAIDGEFALMTGELGELIDELPAWFGGWEKQDMAQAA